MTIIDTHCHFGTSILSDLNITREDLVNSMNEFGVHLALVMPHAVSDDPVFEHDRVADLCSQYPKRFRGIVNLTPLWGEDKYYVEAQRCVKELGFVAIKLNPMQHLASPIMKNAHKVFSTASALGVPVIVHTGLGVPWALPSLCIPPARQFSDTPIILAHAGYGVYTAEAYVAASVCENIYLEPSWCTVEDLKMLTNKVGAQRIMLGSDVPANLPVELAKYRAANLSDTELENCFWKTANRMFQLNW